MFILILTHIFFSIRNYYRHQLTGRIIAFVIVQQLHEALQEWYNTPSFALSDDAWHLTAEYERVRNTVAEMKDTPCYSNEQLPTRICDNGITVRAVSEMLPRYNPAANSIRSILKEGVVVEGLEPNMYDPPDIRNPRFDAPDGHIDVLNIIENGIEYSPNRARQEAIDGTRRPSRRSLEERKPVTSGLLPGKGWYVRTMSAPDNCDGSWNSFCGRSASSDCLLSGHNDDRGGILFDSLSGWLIVNLKLKHGLVYIRVQDWSELHDRTSVLSSRICLFLTPCNLFSRSFSLVGPEKNLATEGWKCENGATDCPEATGGEGNRRARTKQHDRQLKGGNPNKCDAYTFEFAIDGKITVYDKDAWKKNTIQPQRVVTLWVLLDDPDYTGGEEKDVEVAMRMTGCARDTTWSLTHIYYA